MIMNINWKLPEDIVKVIFSKLVFSNLPNCRIVCKAWNHVVLDYASKLHIIPNAFIVYASNIVIQPLIYGIMQMQHSNPKMSCIDFDTTTSVATPMFDGGCKDVQIYNSCNGLIHIKSMSVGVWCRGIWNPMTNEFFKIPRSELERKIYRYGFGFSPKTKQYKLFRITFEDDGFINIIEVWRFGISNQWEHLGCQPFMILRHGTYLDGVIYWLGCDLTNKSVIYVLDADAILDVLGLYSVAKFQPFNGTICLIVFYPPKVKVWIMRAKHSWIREFVIDSPRVGSYRFYPIKAFEDEGDIYFLNKSDLFCFGKNGKKIRIKTIFNPNEKVIKGVVRIEALHFGLI